MMGGCCNPARTRVTGRRCLHGLSKGKKQAVDKFWGRRAKIGFFFALTMFWPRPEKVVQRKKCLCRNNQRGKCHFGWSFGVRPIFRPKTTFRPNVKTPVSPWFRPGPGPLSFWVIFLMARTIPLSFVEIGPFYLFNFYLYSKMPREVPSSKSWIGSTV